MSRESVIYQVGPGGHRASYAQILQGMFGLYPVYDRPSLAVLWRLLLARRVFFGTIDDTVVFFAITSMLRLLTGRKTAGILLRPAACLAPGGVAAVKRIIFGSLRCFPGITAFAIIPHDLAPGISRITRAWVHDPQLWDLAEVEDRTDAELVAQIRAFAKGRKVIAFIGSVTGIKGAGYLARILDEQPDLHCDFACVVMGKVAADVAWDVQAMTDKGVMVQDRHISDDEIEALYACADLVWSCYRPDYDQASGIFGRSVQKGRQAIVRAGSVIAGYGRYSGETTVAIPWNDTATSADRIRSADPKRADRTARPDTVQWKRHFEASVAAALGGGKA